MSTEELQKNGCHENGVISEKAWENIEALKLTGIYAQCRYCRTTIKVRFGSDPICVICRSGGDRLHQDGRWR